MHDLRIQLDTSPVIGFIASKVYIGEWLSSRGHLGHVSGNVVKARTEHTGILRIEREIPLAWEKQPFGCLNDVQIT